MGVEGQLRGNQAKEMPISAPSTPLVVSARRLLVLIVIVGVALRFGSALLQGDSVQPLPGIFDQISYDGLARRLIGGYGFSFATDYWPATRAGEPTAHWSYLYTLYLTAVYLIFGLHPLAARLIQAVIAGILHCWLAWRLGRRIFGPGVGLVAAGLSAFYIYFFYYAGALITEPFYMIGILWTFDVALRLVTGRPTNEPTGRPSPPQWRRWLELGLALGVTVLLRQLFLLFVPFLYGWLWWTAIQNSPGSQWQSPRSWQWQQVFWPPLKGMIVATAVVLLMVVPWTVRNYLAFGAFVPLNTNAGYAFFWGNHPIYGTHFIGILPASGPSYLDLIPTELRPLNEAKLDRALLQRGLGFIKADPVRYALLSLSRAQEYFKFWPSTDSGLISNIARVGSFGLYLPFMLYGLWVSTQIYRQAARADQRALIGLLYLFMAIYTLIHLLTWALIRYRLPVDAILILFAALGVVTLMNRYRPQWRLSFYT